MSSSLALKTLLPEAVAPGWLTVVFAPFMTGFLLLVLCLLSQTDGSLLAFGNNATNQVTVPTAAQTGVAALAAGKGFSLAIKSDGSVLAWGDNTFNQTVIPAGLVAALP